MRATPTPFAEGGSGTRRFSGYKYKCKLVQPLWKMTGEVVITWTLGLHGRSHSLARSPKEQKATSVKRWARKWSQQLNLQLLKTGPGAHRWEEDEEAGLPHKGAASNKEAHRWKTTRANHRCPHYIKARGKRKQIPWINVKFKHMYTYICVFTLLMSILD